MKFSTTFFLLAALVLAAGAPGAYAQGAAPVTPTPMPQTPAPVSPAPATAAVPPASDQTAPLNNLSLAAQFGADPKPVRAGLQWRVFRERAEADGSHLLVAQSSEPRPQLRLPDGDYVVHVAYGLASAMKRVSVHGQLASQTLSLNAGGLSIVGVLGDAPIPASRLSIAVYVPERGNLEARLVAPDARAGSVMFLPEGNYRIISTYLEKDSSGPPPASGPPPNATNSVVTADIRVQTGKLTQATLRHHAATLVLKLVNTPGGEALANTNFSVLTPGGDVIREMIGAFPSLILAEGDYVVIARRDGKTYQSTFSVQSNLDRDIEIIAK